jgi:hypothetical protein
MSLNFEDRKVHSLLGERTATAKFAVCEQCDMDLFFIFQIRGQHHFHLQCAGCGTSYCPQGGDCQYEGERN